MEVQEVVFDTDLVFSTVEHWKYQLTNILAQAEGDVRFDFRQVAMVDSKGFGFLINVFTQLSMKGRKLQIVEVKDDLFQLFKTMRMDRHFTIQPQH